MESYYNHKMKIFPDGTVQHFVYQRSVKCGSDKILFSSSTENQKSKIDHQKRARSEVFDLCRSNKFDYFITLTFDPKIVNSFDYKECCEYIKKYLRKLRDYDCKYIIVPEHHKSGRYHFHGLVKGDFPLLPAINPHTRNVIPGLYNIPFYDYGFTTASKIKDSQKVSTYVSKYLTKEMNLPRFSKRYWCSQGLSRPQVVTEEVDIKSLSVLALEASYSKLIESDYGDIFIYEVQN